MIALVRYHVSLLLRSHRWIPPAILYVLGVVGLGGARQPFGAGLTSGLNWAALMLVPTVAWLTRSMLTAEPPAARAVIAAVAGPRRTQLAALAAAALAGVAIGVAGVVWELVDTGLIRTQGTNTIEVGATVHAVGGGLLAGLICLFVASAIGALCNPPVLRRPGPGMLATTGGVVLAVAWGDSPANAALRTPVTGVQAAPWPSGLPVLAALVLLVVAWVVSVFFAARRDG
jgi:uncharacterized membrane protein